MDLNPTPEQKMLRDAAQKYFRAEYRFEARAKRYSARKYFCAASRSIFCSGVGFRSMRASSVQRATPASMDLASTVFCTSSLPP